MPTPPVQRSKNKYYFEEEEKAKEIRMKEIANLKTKAEEEVLHMHEYLRFCGLNIPSAITLMVIIEAKMKIITDVLPDLRITFPTTLCPKIAEMVDTAAK